MPTQLCPLVVLSASSCFKGNAVCAHEIPLCEPVLIVDSSSPRVGKELPFLAGFGLAWFTIIF